jgi:hypothetical protein
MSWQPIERAAKARHEAWMNAWSVITGHAPGSIQKWEEIGPKVREASLIAERAAIEALRPFIHECIGVTSTSEYPIDKAVDAKIDAILGEKP